MNIEQLQKLTPEQQRAYIEMEKRFTSDVWLWVKDWATAQAAEAEKRAAYAENWEQNRMNMGAVGMLQLLVSLEAQAYQEFELLLADTEEEPEDVGDLQL